MNHHDAFSLLSSLAVYIALFLISDNACAELNACAEIAGESIILELQAPSSAASFIKINYI